MSTLIWCPNPTDIESRLGQTRVKYPKNVRAVNYGYAGVQVIPTLYGYVSEQGEVPTVEAMCRHLWQYHEDDPKREEEAQRRTEKLVLDFYRELHTFGLLVRHDAFGLVRYSKAVDIDLGVDYLARISQVLLRTAPRTPSQIGIQAAMGARHAFEAGGYYQQQKARRKSARGAQGWHGPLYWLTNEHRPATVVQPSGVWLFTRRHIADLVEQVSPSHEVAVSVKMFSDN